MVGIMLLWTCVFLGSMAGVLVVGYLVSDWCLQQTYFKV